MTRRTAPRAVIISLASAIAVSLGVAVSGCGGASPDSSDAFVRTEPGASVSPEETAATPAPAAAPATTTTAPAAPSTSPASTGKSEGWGTLKGQVVFGGTPPPVEELFAKGAAPKDPTVCGKDAPIKSERLVVDPATKGVKFALVYIPKPTAVNPEAKSAAASTDVVFDQKNCVFEPHVLGVMAGSKVVLKSSDPVTHNVGAKLKVNNQFNSTLSAGSTMPYTPGSPERTPALVVCDVHPWMQAYWMVLDNPYYAVTDEKGNFEIKNVPAGTQKVVVWQEAVGFVTSGSGEDVAIAPNGDTTKTFTIDPSKVKPAR